MEAVKTHTIRADLLLKITTSYERVKTRLKEIPKPPSSIIFSSPSSKSESVDPLSAVSTPTAATEGLPDLTTAAISISQIPQVFMLQKLYVSPRMSIDEKIQEVWTRDIKYRLSAVLRHNIPSGTCVQEFMMVGKRPGTLKPTVIITCDDQLTKKRVEKIFKSQGWLQELLKANHMVFITLISKTTLSGGPVLNSDCVETLHESYAVEIPHPEIPTSCGLDLLINGADGHLRQHCTLGGLLVVKGRVLGLTAGHPFSRINDRFLQRKLSEAAEDLDDFNDEEGSSTSSEPFVFDGNSDENENDGSNVPLFEQSDTLSISFCEPPHDRHKNSRSFSSMERSLPQAAILPLPTPTSILSSEDSLHGFDWALLESLPAAVITQPNAILDADQPAYTLIEGIVSGPVCGRVVVIAAGVGSQHGYLHSSPATMQVNGSVLDVQLITLESILPLGSSGAWVVRGDKLCGYIVAIREDMPWAYMVAIQSVLEDIGRRFKTDDVRLPKTTEIVSRRLISNGQELERLNEPEAAQLFHSGNLQPRIPVDNLKEIWKAQDELTSKNISRISSVTDLPGRILVQYPLVNKKIHISNEQDESLTERSSITVNEPRNSMLDSSLSPNERVCENNDPRKSTMGEEASTAPSTTRDYHTELRLLQTTLDAESLSWQRETTQLEGEIATYLPSHGKTITNPRQIWRRFQQFILCIESRRVRGSHRFPTLLVRIFCEPIHPRDYSWEPTINQWKTSQGIYYLHYFIIFIFGNILLNILYWILFFPFIIWVIHRHRHILEPRRIRQPSDERREIVELPIYNDYRHQELTSGSGDITKMVSDQIIGIEDLDLVTLWAEETIDLISHISAT